MCEVREEGWRELLDSVVNQEVTVELGQRYLERQQWFLAEERGMMVSLPWQGSNLATTSWSSRSLESSDVEEGIIIVKPGSAEGANKSFRKSKFSLREDSGNVNLEVGQSDLLTKEMWEEKSPMSRMTPRFLVSGGKVQV